MSVEPPVPGPAESNSQSDRIDQLCDRFEAAWNGADPPHIETFLGQLGEASQEPVRTLLSELLKLDLHYRWRAGAEERYAPTVTFDRAASDAASVPQEDGFPRRPRLEDYVAAFPVLGPAAALPVELIASEYRARRRWDRRPDHAEYLARFGSREGEILERLTEVDAEFDQPADGDRSGAVDDDADLPASIGRYRIVSKLTPGGQAEVFRAIHPTLRCELVVKRSRWPAGLTPNQRDCIVAEGRLLAGLQHPNLARVYDLDFDAGRPFLVMEFVRGQNLTQYLSQQPHAPRAVARLLAKLARALQVAHAKGIVHRDLKPANILIDDQGEPRIIDFGLAVLRDAWHVEESGTGEISGTLSYMPPEQARGESERVDARSDVSRSAQYSIACSRDEHRLLRRRWTNASGRRSSASSMRQRCVSRQSRSALAAICLKAMSAEPSGRYATAEELATALERFADARRSHLRRGVLAAAFVLAAVGVWIFGQGPPTPAPQPSSPPTVAADIPAEKAVPHAGGLQVTVGRQGRRESAPLLAAVPLSNQDNLQVTWESPAGCHSALFWLDTEGKLHELPCQESAGKLYYPANAQGDQLAGPPGTEVIFACGRPGSLPTKDEIAQLLGGQEVWPMLSAHAVLTWNDRQPPEFHQKLRLDRGPSFQVQQRQGEAVQERAQRLCQALAQTFPWFEGLAFPHVAVPAPLTRIHQRHALLVGCDDYPNLDPALRLRGPAHDVVAFRQLLLDRFGFEIPQIAILCETEQQAERQPTLANIQRELRRLAQTTAKDDLVVLYFAGHGAQQPNDDPDNPADPEPDGLDEVFCPIDVVRIRAAEEPRIPGALSDNELHGWLAQIVDGGAWAWLVFDSCHSGTMLRGAEDETPRALPPGTLVPSELIEAARRRAARRQPASRGGTVAEVLPHVSPHLPRVVALYASQADELTVEKTLPPAGENRQRHGLFTFALVEALRQCRTPLTYEELIRQIVQRYGQWGRTSPSPWLEGDIGQYPMLGLQPQQE